MWFRAFGLRGIKVFELEGFSVRGFQLYAFRDLGFLSFEVAGILGL